MKKIIFLLFILSIPFFGNAQSESIFQVDTIYSKSLQENRLLRIYLPPNFEPSKIYKVIYTTDGQLLTDGYKTGLDSLIQRKIIPPVVLIGVFSKEKKIGDDNLEYRNYEYVKSLNPPAGLDSIFENHLEFFKNEVPEYAENNYSVSNHAVDRIFYGTSNGAGFGVSMAAEFPEIIDTYICFSMAGGVYKKAKWTKKNYPAFHLEYGDKEPYPLIVGIIDFDKYLTKKKFCHTLKIYKGGHDRAMWRREFLGILSSIFIEAPEKY